jgi:hypothetical protein
MGLGALSILKLGNMNIPSLLKWGIVSYDGTKIRVRR